MKTYFISSDIHSFYNKWMGALKESGFEIDNPNHIVVVVGDLFDRFTQAVECYNFVKKLNDLNRLIYIRGNHEDLLFDCVNELQQTGGCASPHHWSNGTVDTVKQLKEVGVLNDVLHFIKDNTINYHKEGNDQ